MRLAQLRFAEALGEDVFEFVITCEDGLHNLCLIKTHGVDYTTFQLDLITIP